MLDEYLNRKDVHLFINRIINNSGYNSKDRVLSIMRYATSRDIALFTFYDALFKFMVVVDDFVLFPEYLKDLEKLYKKIDNYDDVSAGINKLICKNVVLKLNIKNLDDSRSKYRIVAYVFDKYIVNGYYFHGFNSANLDDVKKGVFNPEVYNSNYDKMKKIDNIFKKYNINGVFEKDFSKKEIYYTDSLVMGCYYSMYSPLYFYNFLLDNNYFKYEFREDEYLKDGLLNYTKNLKRFMKFNGFSESDKNTVLSIVCDEWRFINSRSNNINLLFVRRSSISNNSNNINDYYDENGNVFELVDKMLCCKKNSISSSTCLYNNYGIINFSDCFMSNFGNLDISNLDDKQSYNNSLSFSNAYGKASIFIILGSLLISFGVIITILMILRGGSL